MHMKTGRIVNFLLIFAGGIIALIADADAAQNQYLLILGIVILMIGLYRLSRGLSSRKPVDPYEPKDEED